MSICKLFFFLFVSLPSAHCLHFYRSVQPQRLISLVPSSSSSSSSSRFLQTSSNKLAAHDPGRAGPGRAGPGRHRAAHREELVKGTEQKYDSCSSQELRLLIYMFIFVIIVKNTDHTLILTDMMAAYWLFVRLLLSRVSSQLPPNYCSSIVSLMWIMIHMRRSYHYLISTTC